MKMEHQNYSYEVAFIAGSLIDLADMSGIALEEVVEFVGVTAISELIAIENIWADLTYEEMARDICTSMEWDFGRMCPLRRDAELDRLGQLVAERVSATETTGGTEAERLCSALSSGDIHWIIVNSDPDDAGETKEEYPLPF